MVKRGESLALDLDKRDLERETSKRYKGFVVRSRLKRVPNETMKCNTFAREEVRFPDRYIEFAKTPDGHVLRSDYGIRETFRVHFRDRLAHLPDLPVQEFRSNFANFLRLQEGRSG